MSRKVSGLLAAGLLLALLLLAGGAAWRESATVDEVAHTGAGLSYLQRLDLRLNPEHPPLAKLLAGIPLAVRGTKADYSSAYWRASQEFFPSYIAQWLFGDAVLGRWNPWAPTLLWARLPMLILTLLLGCLIYVYGSRLGGEWGGLLCLAAYVTTPAILVFGPLVITDLPVTLFSLLAIWQLGELWNSPSPRNACWFGLALGAALLSKFTGLLLIPITFLFVLITRRWPVYSEPQSAPERKLWRRERWLAVWRGLLWALLLVYVVYFVFSWHQPDDALDRLGSGRWAFLIRRPLMPLWLYVRGLFLMLITASRPTFLLGHSYAHGVPYYFPIAFALKSTLAFLILQAANLTVGVLFRKKRERAIPERFRAHWRAINLAFFVFLTVCLVSRLDISIRHFMIPIVALILMLAPLPHMIDSLPRRRILQAATAGLALCSFITILVAYPYFFPFVNSLSLGRPIYYLLNDSNVSWNEALPVIESFVKERRLTRIKLDWASMSDPAIVVPEAEGWDCQAPTTQDAGNWVAVAAVSLLENHNCGYLQGYQKVALAGGSFYAFLLPSRIPAAGAPGGPPRSADKKAMWGMPFDLRSWAIDLERHPEEFGTQLRLILQRFQHQSQTSKH